MAPNIHTIVLDGDAFHTQSRTLFITGGAADRQTDAPAGAEYAVPGQPGVARQLAQSPPDPARGAAQPGKFGQLAITDDFAFRHLRERRVECRASDLRIVFDAVERVFHVRGS